MARIVVTTAGTLGDFVPFLALGGKLKDRGHEVAMAVNPSMLAQAESAGLEPVPCGRPFGAEEVRRRADLFDRPEPLSADALRAHLRELDLGRTVRDLSAAVEGADLLISSSLQGTAPWVHELTGVRWINATIFAMEFPHGDPSSTPPAPQPVSDLKRELFAYRNEVRAEFGLAPVADGDWAGLYWSRRLVLLASSPRFSRPNLDRHPQVRMTGFWFDDREVEESTLDPRLLAFLAGGPPPLVLTFSSQPLRDPDRVVALHAEAAAILGRRLILQRGWGGLDPRGLPETIDRDSVLFVDHVPHSWLFPRAAAVIHHGGIGSTAQALRCGRPMLVEPYCNDQFFNASRAEALGVGAAADPASLTPPRLAEILEARVLTDEVAARADELSQAIRSEDGLDTACRLIEAEFND
jgi:UDP:flavonoid glycosyltransferase YjiC (YdhE family)